MEWHIKKKRLRLLFEEVLSLIKEKKIDFKIEWIPRSRNKAGKVLG